MSEYQCYEFLAIDRPLNPEAIAYVRTLSSRVEPTPTHAVFTYSYGDFRGDPLDLLAKHYDVLLYRANWGTKQLAFRFPQAAVDLKTITLYANGIEEIELTSTRGFIILNITFQDEGMSEWIEPGDLLTSLAPLRDDIMRCDLRALYLAWLASAERALGIGPVRDGADAEASEWDDEDAEPLGWDDIDLDDLRADELIEPPVPAGLGQLTGPLHTFRTFFAIDQDLVAAAALASAPYAAADEPLALWLPRLSEAERTAFLLRAAQGEQIGAELLHRLRAVGDPMPETLATVPPRTFATLITAAHGLRLQREERERQAAEQARLARLEALARREPQVWKEVEQALARRTGSGYAEAVAQLAELHELAIQYKQSATFEARLAEVLGPYATSAALQRRLREQGLI